MDPVELTWPQSQTFEATLPGNSVNMPWGRGSGKSWFERFVALLHVAKWDGIPRAELLERLGIKLKPGQKVPRGLRGVRIVFLTPTLKQFKDVHGRLIQTELADMFGHGNFKIDRTEWKIDFPGGSWIQAFPADLYTSKRALGLRADFVIIDECDDIDIAVWETVIKPWFSEPASLKMSLTGGTPRRGRLGLLYRRHKEGLDPTRPRSFSFLATYRDSPEIVDQDEVEEARRDMIPAVFEREWECNFDSGEGLVFNFDEQFHVNEPPDLHDFREFHVGMDHGTVDAGVLLLAGVLGHGKDATLWILDEYYESGIPNHVWDKRAKLWGDLYRPRFWPDTSRADRIQDLRGMGLDVGETDRGPGSIAAGIARVADLLHIREDEVTGPAFQPVTRRFARLYVSPKCVNLIREFGLYRWVRRPDGTFDERPEDRNNHAIDSLRYVALGVFGRPANHRHESPR